MKSPLPWLAAIAALAIGAGAYFYYLRNANVPEPPPPVAAVEPAPKPPEAPRILHPVPEAPPTGLALPPLASSESLITETVTGLFGRESYARFMGSTPENPRSDFTRRLTNFDRAADAGMWAANPGVLLGLHDDVGFELLALLAHIRHLRARGLEVYVSLPRLRRASGTSYATLTS